MPEEEDFTGEEIDAVPYEDKPEFHAPQVTSDGIQDQEDEA